ncbi:MAG TPA: 30S ribosomal protein S12 methylthiotransferase RimO [Planctomycetota bacterium]|nr:30S ribosomal protein S12 methylthiotransferase RimO [Planctomycetota bacterium]
MKSPRVSFVSLGCAKNLVDSEVLLGHLAKGGFDLCADYKQSDVVVVNTCGFLASSEKESMDTIESMVALKGKGRLKAVVVAGCLPQRYGIDFEKRLHGVDAVLGITNREKIADVCSTILEKTRPERPVNLVSSELPKYEIDRDRVRLTPRHSAYVRLSEGCDHTCAFCVIPQIRGKFRSKPMDVIRGEVEELARDGAKEINLIAQDTTSYGLDLYRKLVLDELLRNLEEVKGVEWIRLLYCYPSYVTDRLMKEVARNSKVVKYVDMPVQHTKERMLRAMRRGVTEASQKDLIKQWRDLVPGLTFRTTVIVGFPGETEEDFAGMLEDLRELRFERLGAFQYSKEPGSRAEGLEGQVPEDEKVKRYGRVMQQQQEIAFAVNRAMVNKVVPVIVEKKAGKKAFEGRTSGDAPDIDTQISLHGNSVQVGQIARARVTGFNVYDLIGDLV